MNDLREIKIKQANEYYFEVVWFCSALDKTNYKIYASKKLANNRIIKLIKSGIEEVFLCERESKFDVLQTEFKFTQYQYN